MKARKNRNKRHSVPLNGPEYLRLRSYSARKNMPMSRVLLYLVTPHLEAMERGEDPLNDVVPKLV